MHKFSQAVTSTTTSHCTGPYSGLKNPTPLQTMNASSSMPQIPCELFHPILKHLKDDNASLCAISLCSSTFRQEAQSILFRNVTTLTKDSGAHLKFLRTIAASPTRLALLVRAYKVSISGIHPQLFTAMGDGLQAMHNLKRLGIHKRYPRHRGRESAASVLLECTFNLEGFEWTSHPPDAQGIFETFLPRQDSLKHLGIRYITHYSSSTSLEQRQPTMCPQLSSLKGTWDVIKVLLPSHQITTLEVLNGSFPTPNATEMSALVPALKHIKVISYQTSYSHLRDLVLVLQHCTSLTVMELEKVNEDEVLEIVCESPALHTLIISQGYWINLLERDIVHLIFDTCSMNLQRIEILNSPETYARYSRSQDTAQKVSKSEVRKVWRR